jgi:hypothetical protein
MANAAPPLSQQRRYSSPPRRTRRRRRSGWWIALAVVALGAAAAAVGVFVFSGARLEGDPVALARVSLQPFAGSIVGVTATDASGRPVPLTVRSGRLTPRRSVTPGELVSVTVIVRRPGWSSWALGRERRETLTVRAPVAHVRQQWLTVPAGGHARVHFDTTVSTVSFGSVRAQPAATSAVLPTRSAAGSVEVAAAARPWERLGAPVLVTWFPQSKEPVVLARPAPGAHIAPLTPLRLTFSRPVADVLGTSVPKLPAGIHGTWVHADSHSLVFRPSGRFGLPFTATVRVRFPREVAVAGAGSRTARPATDVSWSVAPASFLRLQQLLAVEGYLPLDWSETGGVTPSTPQAQLAAAVAPPQGTFSWRYQGTPSELQALWQPGEPNEIVRGAVMMFEDEHQLTVDGIVGPQVWHVLLADALAGKRRTAGYSYVYVHRNVPQLMTLWHDGRIVLTSPGNTGVPAAPTALGTWPVFEHIPVGTMSGTNPDGSHYNDPGIRWISYFHGGEALHAFNRASFGTPQSLGCVELPLSAAAAVWPYTPIGTLVTIEN